MRPPLFLGDLDLPDRSGLMRVERIRPRLDALGCHGVVVTAAPESDIVDDDRPAKEQGIDEFVGKPFELAWLKPVQARLRARPGRARR